MSTPDFLPQDDNNFTPVRYYTAQDPYYYTIDNRPLEDLEANLKLSRTGGGDAARRAAALLAMNLGAVYSELITTGGRTSAISGLNIIRLGVNAVRVMPGAVYDTRSVSENLMDSMVKQALLTKNVDFNLPSPVTGGTSMVYTIEGTFIEFNSNNLANSQLPYVDGTNRFLPSTYIHGELQLSLTVGSSDVTGRELPAPTTAGKFPIYNITMTQGSTLHKIEMHANAPRALRMAREVTPTSLAVGGATITSIEESPALKLSKTSIGGVSAKVALHEREINPHLPIRAKITFSPSMVGGVAAFRLRYRAFANGELITTGTNTDIEPVIVTTVANGVQVYVTDVCVKPWEFSGYVSNKWMVNKDFLNLVIERVSNDAIDTNPGDINILAVTLVQ
jgi:hypothetical protein